MRYICTSIVAMLALTGTSLAATINVPADYTTIQEAIDASLDGDRIVIAPGIYAEHLVIQSKSITLSGMTSWEETAIDGTNSGRCLEILGDPALHEVTLEDLTFQKGHVTYQSDTEYVYGGGVFCDVSLTMNRCLIAKCYASGPTSGGSGGARGGGLYLGDGTGVARSVLRQSFFLGNVASGRSVRGGGLYGYQDGLLIESCLISGNTVSFTSTGSGVGASISFGTELNSCWFDGTQSISGGTVWANYNVFLGGLPDTYAGFGNQTTSDYIGMVGACCLEGDCQVITVAECAQVRGLFADYQTTCNELTCTNYLDPYGACCVNGNCGSMTANSCTAIGGEWQGDYSICVQVECTPLPVLAACCLGSMCISLNEETCNAVMGVWQGDTSDCDTSKCEPWIGACCVSGACTEITLEDCADLGGTYFGDLTACADIECPGTCLGDLNGDGDVAVDDILILLSGYGPCP